MQPEEHFPIPNDELLLARPFHRRGKTNTSFVWVPRRGGDRNEMEYISRG